MLSSESDFFLMKTKYLMLGGPQDAIGGGMKRVLSSSSSSRRGSNEADGAFFWLYSCTQIANLNVA